MIRLSMKLATLAWLSAGGMIMPFMAHAVPIEITYSDGPSEGFNDPLVGASRRAALQAAVDIWSQLLPGSVPIVVEAAMDDLGGNGESAVLASTRATTVHRDFLGAPQGATYYGAALANELSNIDLNGASMPEIHTTFNSSVDGPSVLGSISFYYGIDAEAGSDIDFETIALHELGHGLGFFDAIDLGSGMLLLDAPTIFDTYLVWPVFGTLINLQAAERRQAIQSGDLVWAGPFTVQAYGSAAPLFAPKPPQPGSSVSHWDSRLVGQLMAPSYSAPVHDPGLLLPALRDLGWNQVGGQPISTPIEATATPTATRTMSPTPMPARRAETHPEVYVSNFGDDTVTVINGTSLDHVVQTIPVGASPLGIAAGHDGRFVYVANFGDESITVIRTGSHRVAANIPIGSSCNSIVLTPDDQTAFVSNTAENTVSVVDLTNGSLKRVIEMDAQPANLAITPDSQLVLVSEYGGQSIAVIDVNTLELRAIISVQVQGPLGLAVIPSGQSAYVAAMGAFLRLIDIPSLSFKGTAFGGNIPNGVEAIAISANGATAYVGGASAVDPLGWAVTVVDLAAQQVLQDVTLEGRPSSIGLTADGAKAYVAIAPAQVSVIRTGPNLAAVIARLTVGNSPMEVSVVAVADCVGD
jgi:YVTN family beta-propeller protein